MRLTRIALLAVNGAKDSKKALSDALGVSIDTVYRYIANNDDSLTKASALKVIREITGLNDEEILEAEPASSELGR